MPKVQIELDEETVAELERMREELDCDTVDSTILQLIEEAGYSQDDDEDLDDDDEDEDEDEDEDGDIPGTGEDEDDSVTDASQTGGGHPTESN